MTGFWSYLRLLKIINSIFLRILNPVFGWCYKTFTNVIKPEPLQTTFKIFQIIKIYFWFSDIHKKFVFKELLFYSKKGNKSEALKTLPITLSWVLFQFFIYWIFFYFFKIFYFLTVLAVTFPQLKGDKTFFFKMPFSEIFRLIKKPWWQLKKFSQ